MTRDEADQRAAELNRSHPERGAYRWLVREGADGWQVARVTIPGGVRIDPLQATVESKPQPDAPDPRPAFERNVGGPYGVF